MIAERGQGQSGADGRSAHPGHDEPTRAVVRLEMGRVDPPERIPEVLGQGQDVVQLPGAVHAGYRVARELAHRLDAPAGDSHQNLIAPSGSSTLGKMRAPPVMTLSAPTVTPSPSTAPPVIWVRGPTCTPAATMQSRRRQ